VSSLGSSIPVRDALGGSAAARGKQDPNRELKVLTGDLERAANAIIAKYPNSRSATLPLLFLAQAKDGHLTEEGMRDVAQLLGLTPADVLASASFYTMFKKKDQGKYLISVCRNISCTHLGSRKVVTALQARLGIEPGQTTPDGMFSLESAECLGTCDGAPAMQINYEDFYKVTPEEALKLVDRLSRDEEVRSVRGQPVQTARQISYEIAVTGAYKPKRKTDASAQIEKPPVERKVESPAAEAEGPSTHTEEVQAARREEHVTPPEERKEQARLVGGVTLPPDLAPGWRPRVQGAEGRNDA
jgi:NADH-quinone oxidoreductase subunit E